MPTVGWIQETATDNYWERGGTSDDLPPPAPPSYPCPFCREAPTSQSGLAQHISLVHPVERPLVLLGGQPVPSRFRIRTVVKPSDITFLNCRTISLAKDGAVDGLLTPKQVSQRLTRCRHGHFKLALENGRSADDATSHAEYVVEVAIADAASLNAVDKAFVLFLTVDAVSMTAVTAFADVCSRHSAASDYATALASYVTGVIIKDQDAAAGATLEFGAYKEKFQSALTVLAEFDRPIANAVCACIRFNLNNFRSSATPSGVKVLDAALNYFWTLASGGTSKATSVAKTPGQLMRLCPVDRLTDEILVVFDRLSNASSVGAISRAMDRIESGVISGYDRVKYQALVGDHLSRNGAEKAAQSIFEALSNDTIMGDWASAQLDKLTR